MYVSNHAPNALRKINLLLIVIKKHILHMEVHARTLNTMPNVVRVGMKLKKHEHVIDTTKEWNEASFKNWPYKDTSAEGL